jgi:hypothetical protein
MARAPRILGPWDSDGFAQKQLDGSLASRVFTEAGSLQLHLQHQMLQQEQAEGHVSLDHVHQLAKRMEGSYEGMLIACGASGNVLGFWNVFSTSLMDAVQQIRALDQQQRALYNTVSCCLVSLFDA